MPKEADTVRGGVKRNTVSVIHRINIKEDSIKKSRSSDLSGKMNGKESSRGSGKTGIALKLKTVLKKEMVWSGKNTMR